MKNCEIVRTPEGVPKTITQSLTGLLFFCFYYEGVRTRKGLSRPAGSSVNCRAGEVSEATEQGAEGRQIAAGKLRKPPKQTRVCDDSMV